MSFCRCRTEIKRVPLQKVPVVYGYLFFITTNKIKEYDLFA